MRNLCIALLTLGVAVVMQGCGDTEPGDHHHGDSSMPGMEGGAHEHAPPAASGAPAHATRLIFNAEPKPLPAGAPATWTLQIVDDSTGKPVEKFATAHEKLMHLIVVSADLSWFNHLHPEYKGNGEFVVTTTLPRAGRYRIFADHTPEGKPQEVPQQEIVAGDEGPSVTGLLAADTLGEKGWMVKHVTSAPEGMPDAAGGGEYEVVLMPMPGKLVAGKEAMLHFQVRDGAGKPIANLEPYLGAMGHAVILSSDGKTYLHAHPMEEKKEGMHHEPTLTGTAAEELMREPESSGSKQKKSDVIFHTTFPEPGLYKVWGEFQHKGKIITAAFVVKVGVA